MANRNRLTVFCPLQIFMHGNNLNSLHQLIHPEILPSELGGMMPPYDMGTWARTLLDHAYDEETDYCPESYTLSVQDLERDLEKNLSPKTMKRSALNYCCLWEEMCYLFILYTQNIPSCCRDLNQQLSVNIHYWRKPDAVKKNKKTSSA